MEYLLSSNHSFPLVKWLVEKLDWQHVNLVNSLQSCQLMTNDLCLLIGNLLQQLCGPSHHHVCGSKQNKLAQFWTQFRDTELTRAHVPIQTSLVNKSAKWKLTHSPPNENYFIRCNLFLPRRGRKTSEADVRYWAENPSKRLRLRSYQVISFNLSIGAARKRQMKLGDWYDHADDGDDNHVLERAYKSTKQCVFLGSFFKCSKCLVSSMFVCSFS